MVCNVKGLPGETEGAPRVFARILRDVELMDHEKDLLYNPIQNARSKENPIFKWKSEIIRQLKNYEKILASRLYKWERKSAESGIHFPDLLRIVILHVLTICITEFANDTNFHEKCICSLFTFSDNRNETIKHLRRVQSGEFRKNEKS